MLQRSVHRWEKRSFALLVCAAAVVGCAAQPPSDEREVRLGANVRVYDMYDNSRDGGPSFLVGPPGHHLGDESRIEDTRPVLQNDTREGTAAVDPAAPVDPTGPADPATPPKSDAAPTPLTVHPLPALP